MRQRVALSLLAACLVVGLATTAIAKKGSKRADDGPRPSTYTLPGDRVFPEGIASEPGSKTFYVTSTTDGTVFRGDLRSPQLTPFAAPGADGHHRYRPEVRQAREPRGRRRRHGQDLRALQDGRLDAQGPRHRPHRAGIAIGKYAIVVQSGSGKLFRVDLRDKSVSEVDLGGQTVPMGDGLLIAGKTLYVVRNATERRCA